MDGDSEPQQAQLLCPNCGTMNRGLGGGGLLVMLSMSDAHQLIGLFEGFLDKVCRGCKPDAKAR